MPPSDDTTWTRAGRDALRSLDKALEDRPQRDGATLKAAVQGLAQTRDGVVALQRRDGGTRWRKTLEHLNAVISVVMAAEFPIGEVPWGELEAARGWLASLLDDATAQ